MLHIPCPHYPNNVPGVCVCVYVCVCVCVCVCTTQPDRPTDRPSPPFFPSSWRSKVDTHGQREEPYADLSADNSLNSSLQTELTKKTPESGVKAKQNNKMQPYLCEGCQIASWDFFLPSLSLSLSLSGTRRRRQRRQHHPLIREKCFIWKGCVEVFFGGGGVVG